MKHTQKLVLLPYEKYLRLTKTTTRSGDNTSVKENDIDERRESDGDSKSSENIDPHPSDDILLNIAHKRRSKAKLLLKYIKNNRKLSWNGKGELKVGDVVVNNSHIIDLINDSLSKSSNFQPVGAVEFYTNLDNIPISLVRNSSRLSLLPTEQKLKPHLPPPGIPNKKPIALSSTSFNLPPTKQKPHIYKGLGAEGYWKKKWKPLYHLRS